MSDSTIIANKWEPVIGLEIHVQLNTESKIFSSAPIATGREPNQTANIVDLAFPGTLPVLNQRVLQKAIQFGLATSAQIAATCRFDRKSYFYPDLPKGYQITQLAEPILKGGSLDFMVDDATSKRIELTRAHLEEDAGKSIHDRFPGSTGIDLNRAGVPLLEIVTEPQLRSPKEAAACFRHLHGLVTWLQICDGNLNEGSMRCDANVSVRRTGDELLGERTEIKNINSFRFVEKALKHEIDRQISVLESGGKIVRETRLYDVERDQTRTMRGKEFAHDYRYFPDPDLLPVAITQEMVQEVRCAMPELPQARCERFKSQFSLDLATATRLTQDRATSDYFERVLAVAEDAQLAANWILGNVAAALNRDEISIDEFSLAPSELGEIIRQIVKGNISDSGAKRAFDNLVSSGGRAIEAIAQIQSSLIDNEQELLTLIQSVLDDHQEQVEQVRNGNKKVVGFLVGQVMKAAKGRVDPKQVNLILNKLVST